MKFWKEHKQLIFVLILSLLVLAPNIYGSIIATDLYGSISKRVGYIVLSFLVFIVPALFLKAKPFFLWQSINLMIGPMEISHLYLNKMPTSLTYLRAFFTTNVNETIETLSSVLPIFLSCVAIIIIYFWILFTQIKNEYIVPKKLRIGVAIAIPAALVTLYGAMLVFSFKVNPEFTKAGEHFGYAGDKAVMKFKKIFPCNIYIAGANLMKMEREMRKDQELLDQFEFGIEPKEDKSEEVVVFILGETSRYANFGLYGYSRNTTPNLSKRSNLIAFDSCYSMGNATGVVLPLLLTRGNPKQPELGIKERAIPEAFNEANFYTAWIANQAGESSYIHRIAKNCDFHSFELTDADAHNNFDCNLLVPFEKVLKSHHKQKFIVIHTQGSHFKYNLRYPKEFDKFHPSIQDNFNYSFTDDKTKELLTNTYDNTILYVDHFLNEVINRLDSTNKVAAMIYVSDHGENLMDTEENLILHCTYKGTEYEFHVPCILWMSDEYKAKYPEKYQMAEQNKKVKLSSGIMFHTLLDLADIHYPDEQLNKSVVSPQFKKDSIIYGLNVESQMIKLDFKKKK